MRMFLGHGGENHVADTVNVLSKVLHQPTWVGVLTVIVIVSIVYLIARQLKLTMPVRLFVIVVTSFLLSAVYLPHNPSVTGIVLSAGFIATFLLTFTLLAKTK